MNNITDDTDRLKKSTKYDVTRNMCFQCLLGKTEAVLGIFVEPDPHGDETGTHAHFHTTLTCPNKKIVDFPEPDRCQIMNKTCRFIAPLGSHERDPELRKRDYAHTIIRMMAFVEFYGSQLVNTILATKGRPPIRYNLRLVELARIMIISGLIDKELFQEIDKLRRIRNKLTHNPKEYLNFSEKELFELSMDAQELSYTVRKLVEEFTNQTK